MRTRIRRVSILALLVLSFGGVDAVHGDAGSSPPAPDRTIWDLERYETEVLAEVIGTSPASESVGRRAFRLRVLADGGRYRVECDSVGDDLGLHPGFTVAFDGLHHYLVLPHSRTVLRRAGDLDGPLPMSIPDPLSLLYRAADAQAAQLHLIPLSPREIASDSGLRDSLRSFSASIGRSGSMDRNADSQVSTTERAGEGKQRVSWKQIGSTWVPMDYGFTAADAEGGHVEWRVDEFMSAETASGISGVPKRLRYEAVDPTQTPFSRLVITYDTLTFKVPVATPPAEAFQLDEADFARVYDEDSQQLEKH